MRTQGILYFDVDNILDEIFEVPSSVREQAPAMRHTKHNVDKYACEASGVDAEPVGSSCTDVHSKRYFPCDQLPQTAHHAK
eukprot:11055936-Karenia_brevis.AAC.1